MRNLMEEVEGNNYNYLSAVAVMGHRIRNHASRLMLLE